MKSIGGTSEKSEDFSSTRGGGGHGLAFRSRGVAKLRRVFL